MELLILLLQNNGKLVRREVINRRLWGENAYHDTDHSVNTAVNKLRYILRDDPRDPRFIQTVVGQGYRFIAEVAAEPFLPEPILNGSEPAPVRLQSGDEKPPAATNDSQTGLLEPLPPVAVPAANQAPPIQPAGRLFLRRWGLLSLCSPPPPPCCICTAHGLRFEPKNAVGGFHSIAVLPSSTSPRIPIRTTSSMG